MGTEIRGFVFLYNLIIYFTNIQPNLAKDFRVLGNYYSKIDSTEKKIKVAAAQILTYPDSIPKNLGKILGKIREA